jgi:hypothetical protein
VSEEDKMIEDLILQGALQIAGIDIESGEMLYNFTDKMKTINPSLHDEFSKYFSVETMALWQYGFLDMDVTDKNPMVRLTPKALDKEEVAKLNKNHQYTLKEIIRILLDS